MNGVSDWCGLTLPVNCLSITSQIPSFDLCGKETWRTLLKVVLLVSILLSRDLLSVYVNLECLGNYEQSKDVISTLVSRNVWEKLKESDPPSQSAIIGHPKEGRVTV